MTLNDANTQRIADAVAGAVMGSPGAASSLPPLPVQSRLDVEHPAIATTYVGQPVKDTRTDVVFAAFQAYWLAYLKAFDAGDTTALQQVTTASAFDVTSKFLQPFKARHWVPRFTVTSMSSPVIQTLSDSAAVVTADISTHEQLWDERGNLLSDKTHTFRQTDQFVKDGDAWKVSTVYVGAPISASASARRGQ